MFGLAVNGLGVFLLFLEINDLQRSEHLLQRRSGDEGHVSGVVAPGGAGVVPAVFPTKELGAEDAGRPQAVADLFHQGGQVRPAGEGQRILCRNEVIAGGFDSQLLEGIDLNG